jgi:hypothetical protein
VSVRLDGWNHIPRGYGLTWDLGTSPAWLRIWLATPFLDRLAYPVLIRRQVAWLVPHPGWRDEDRDPVPRGWLVKDRSETPGV